jgi:hypothetical protein
VWVLHERRYRRTREPLVSLELFRIRSYVLGAPLGLLYFAGFIALFDLWSGGTPRFAQRDLQHGRTDEALEASTRPRQW